MAKKAKSETDESSETPVDTLSAFCKVVASKAGRLGSVKISGVRLDQPSTSHLNIRFRDVDEHVAKYPSLVAFWQGKESQIKSVLRDLRDKLEKWERKHYRRVYRLVLKAFRENGIKNEKPTINDVRAEMEYRYGDVWQEFRDEVAEWEDKLAAVSSFREGVTQKGFSLQGYSRMVASEKSGFDGSR